MQPCTLKRTLLMFPRVKTRSRINNKLTSNSTLWQELPSQLKSVQYPRLPGWKGCSKVTLMVIATACLTALFLGLRYEPMRIGHWMVQATAAERGEMEGCQLQRKFRDSKHCHNQWWDEDKSQAYKALSVEGKSNLDTKAAQAVFLNPPVSPVIVSDGRLGCMYACMCLRQGKAKGKHIQWVNEYPHLVLQDAVVTDDGHEYPQITVPAHVLIAWLFLGPQPAGTVVCHHDAPAAVAVEWATSVKKKPKNAWCFPSVKRCISKACVSPLCVFYGTQSENAQTGRASGQLAQRKSRMKKLAL
jgi:hypothetical protein